jgi:hypothetical protein
VERKSSALDVGLAIAAVVVSLAATAFVYLLTTLK